MGHTATTVLETGQPGHPWLLPGSAAVCASCELTEKRTVGIRKVASLYGGFIFSSHEAAKKPVLPSLLGHALSLSWALATLPHELEKDSSSWTEKNTSTIQIQFVFFRCKELHSQTLNVIVQLTQGSSAGRTGIAGVAARTLILGSFFGGDN